MAGKICEQDCYQRQIFLDCITYIELNPVRANLVSFPYEYAWSSYRERNLEITTKEKVLNEIEI